jgi:hypothetical protein
MLILLVCGPVPTNAASQTSHTAGLGPISLDNGALMGVPLTYKKLSVCCAYRD